MQQFHANRTLLCATLAALSAASLSCYAAADDPLFEIRGFGSFAATRTDESTAGYRVYPQTSSKANKWAFDTDSLLGVQVDVAPKEQLSAVVQVIGRKREQSSWDPEVEWAYVKYDFSPAWRLRVGRVLTPVFMESDYRFIGYANTFARPDNAVYSTYPLSNHDGFDLTYRTGLGSGMLALSGYGGKASLDVPGQLTYGGDLLGVTATYELDDPTVRFGHVKLDAKITGNNQGLKTIATNLATASRFGCTTCVDIGQKYDRTTNGFDFSVTDIGLRYTMGELTTWAEYAWSDNTAVLQPSESFLLGASYNLGKWTPYVAYGNYKTKGNDKTVVTNAPGAFAALAAVVNSSLENQASSRNTLALGTRYDFYKNFALKAEVSRVTLDKANANPNAFPVVPAVAAGVVVNRPQNFNLFTLAVDFVF